MFPNAQGGPLMHIVASKAVAFGEAMKPEFVAYQKAIVANASALAEGLVRAGCASFPAAPTTTWCWSI